MLIENVSSLSSRLSILINFNFNEIKKINENFMDVYNQQGPKVQRKLKYVNILRRKYSSC